MWGTPDGRAHASLCALRALGTGPFRTRASCALAESLGDGDRPGGHWALQPRSEVSRNLPGHRLQPGVPGIRRKRLAEPQSCQKSRLGADQGEMSRYSLGRQFVGSSAGSLGTRLRLADLPRRRCQARCNTMHAPQPHADTSTCLGPLRTTLSALLPRGFAE